MEQAQIGHALIAVALGRRHGQQARIFIQPMNQLVRRQRGGQQAIAIHLGQEGRAPGGQIALPGAHAPHRDIEGAVFVRHPDTGAVVRRKAKGGGEHHGQQRHVQKGIVDKAQKGHGDGHLGRGEEAAGRRRPCRNAAGVQFVGIGLRVGGFAAQKNAEIPEPGRALSAFIGDGQGVQKLVDPAGNQAGFRRVPGVLLGHCAGVQHQQLGFVTRPVGIGGGGNQLLPLIVGNAACLPAHQLPEHEIDRVGDLRAAAEIIA